MTAFGRLLAGAGRVSVLAAARVRTATADSTAALRAAATRASALLRPGADYLRDGSPRWRSTLRPAMEDFLQRPDDFLRRTRESLRHPTLTDLRAATTESTAALRAALSDLAALVRSGRSRIRDSVAVLDSPRWRHSVRPGTDDFFQAIRRGRDGEDDAALWLWPRLLQRLPRLGLRRSTDRRTRARHVEPHGDDVLVDDQLPEADDDGDRIKGTLYLAARRLSSTRLWKAFWDAFLDYHRLKTWLLQVRAWPRKAKAPGQRPRRLPLRPACPHTTPRPIPYSSSALRSEMIEQRLDWLLLANVAAVDADLPQAQSCEVHLSAETPPRPSTLTVSAAISAPFTTVEDSYPYVAAVADSLLLLRASPEDSVTSYYVLNLLSGTSTLLPLPAGAPLIPGCVGILSHAAAGYTVLAFEPRAPAEATLHFFDSQSGGVWSAVDVEVEGGGSDREWSGHDVVSHGGRIVWVDLTQGFLCFDAHCEEPGIITFLPLPTGRELPAGTTGVERLRCAALCQGVLRYAEVVTLDALNLSVVVLELWSYEEEERTWLRDRAVALEELWDARELPPREVPCMALIHPHRHMDILYVTIGSIVYAADLRHRRVVAHARFDIHAPPAELLSSHFVRGWMPSA